MNTRFAPVLTPLALIVMGLGSGCSPDPDATRNTSPETQASVLQSGRRIVTQAGRALSSVLIEAMRDGGPTNALPLCSVQAIPLTASLAQANQVQLRRVSHRPRNPANRAEPEELALIAGYHATLSAGRSLQPTVRTNHSQGFTFYAPIVITTNLCLTCHGVASETLNPEVIPLLATLYPSDEATGFALGELRGLWCVDFPPDSLNTEKGPP